MRHGQSAGNVRGRISSRITTNMFDPPLTEIGQKEVTKSALKFFNNTNLSDFFLISSPFRRTRQTAEIVSSIISCKYEIDWRLRERDFGIFDRMSDKNYDLVWKNDKAGLLSDQFLVEPIQNVLDRIRSLVSEIIEHPSNSGIILFTHGDVASIALTGFAGEDLSHHRQFGALETAEIRLLVA